MSDPTILSVLPVPPYACPEDPTHHPGMRLFVGARLEHDVVGERKRHVLSGGTIREETVPKTRPRFVFAEGEHEVATADGAKMRVAAQRVPNTPYYRERVRHGDLRAADAETAAACGVSFAKPVPIPTSDETPRRARKE